jgi:hypothetical protein
MRGRVFYFLCLFLLSAALAPGCTKRQTTKGVMDWEERIAIMIVRAEQLGARECSPRELARAKVLLDHAIHEREEGIYPASWLGTKLVEAERMAQELLEKRVMANKAEFPFGC